MCNSLVIVHSQRDSKVALSNCVHVFGRDEFSIHLGQNPYEIVVLSILGLIVKETAVLFSKEAV